jgi:hypothetical protein
MKIILLFVTLITTSFAQEKVGEKVYFYGLAEKIIPVSVVMEVVAYHSDTEEYEILSQIKAPGFEEEKREFVLKSEIITKSSALELLKICESKMNGTLHTLYMNLKPIQTCKLRKEDADGFIEIGEQACRQEYLYFGQLPVFGLVLGQFEFGTVKAYKYSWAISN